MAYVAITDRLVNDVATKISRMETAELNAMPNPASLKTDIGNDPAIQTKAVEKLWEPVADLRERLEPFNRTVTLRVKVLDRTENAAGESVTSLLFEHDFQATVPCTTKIEEGYYPRAKVTMYSDIDPRCAVIAEQTTARREAEVRWAAVAKQVTEFLRSCKSLNEAVKLWPDVARYIDKSDLERLEKNAPKAQKEVSKAMEALKAMDLDAINASTVLARMAGAKV
jgi:hypothetical protein